MLKASFKANVYFLACLVVSTFSPAIYYYWCVCVVLDNDNLVLYISSRGNLLVPVYPLTRWHKRPVLREAGINIVYRFFYEIIRTKDPRSSLYENQAEMLSLMCHFTSGAALLCKAKVAKYEKR